MIEYKIITSPLAHGVESDVQIYLNDGWKLQGELICTGTGTGSIYFTQVLIRETKYDKGTP